jgi:hypothetical protein
MVEILRVFFGGTRDLPKYALSGTLLTSRIFV